MVKMKPIQATPTLSGEDAMRVIRQVNKKPSEETIKKYNMWVSILDEIQKK